jgi:hypothetical protein
MTFHSLELFNSPSPWKFHLVNSMKIWLFNASLSTIRNLFRPRGGNPSIALNGKVFFKSCSRVWFRREKLSFPPFSNSAHVDNWFEILLCGQIAQDKKGNNLIHKSPLRLGQFVLNRFVCAFEIYFFDENFCRSFQAFFPPFVLTLELIIAQLYLLFWRCSLDLCAEIWKRKIFSFATAKIDRCFSFWRVREIAPMMIMLIDEGILNLQVVGSLRDE